MEYRRRPTTFRIDDVSLNTSMGDVLSLVNTITAACPDAVIILAISPLVHDVSKEPPADQGRAFPRIINAMSDHRNFFRVSRAGVPAWVVDAMVNPNVKTASHGLVHVDHRLLGREAQELSIVASCTLVGANTFVPPFNHWNDVTREVCSEHKIRLVRFEDGWRHVRFNKYDPTHGLYYLHTHDTPADWLRRWFEGSA